MYSNAVGVLNLNTLSLQLSWNLPTDIKISKLFLNFSSAKRAFTKAILAANELKSNSWEIFVWGNWLKEFHSEHSYTKYSFHRQLRGTYIHEIFLRVALHFFVVFFSFLPLTKRILVIVLFEIYYRGFI